MSRDTRAETVPSTVQKAREFTRRFNLIAISTMLVGGIGGFVAPLALLPSHEKLAVLIGLVLSITLCVAPFAVWGKKLGEAQKVLSVWAKIEAEEYNAVMERQLRLEMARQTPAEVRLRQLARQRVR